MDVTRVCAFRPCVISTDVTVAEVRWPKDQIQRFPSQKEDTLATWGVLDSNKPFCLGS